MTSSGREGSPGAAARGAVRVHIVLARKLSSCNVRIDMPTSKPLSSGMAASASLPFLQVDAFHTGPVRRQPGRHRLPGKPAQRRLAAGGRRRDEPVGDRLPASPRRRPLRPALVHAGRRGDAVRTRDAGQRARAVVDRSRRCRRADRVRDVERCADGAPARCGRGGADRVGRGLGANGRRAPCPDRDSFGANQR